VAHRRRRRREKKREAQRQLVDDTVDALLDAQERKDDDYDPLALAPDDSHEGLCDEGNLKLFTEWYALGGLQQGIALGDFVEMPATMRKDFLTILRRMNRRRKQRKRLDELATEVSKQSLR